MPNPATVQPRTAACNWKTYAEDPHYAINWSSTPLQMESRLSHCLLRYPPGASRSPWTIWELRNIERRPIDATMLRTCKKIHRVGTRILHSDNDFGFPMLNTAWKSSPPSIDAQDELFRPNPCMPRINEDYGPVVTKGDRESIIDLGVTEIKDQVSLESLGGCIYYDPFLRWLYTIGPKNAALHKSLTFSGVIQLHRCSWTQNHR